MMKYCFQSLVFVVAHIAFVCVHHFWYAMPKIFEILGQPGIWFFDSIAGTADKAQLLLPGADWPAVFWLCMIVNSLIWGAVAGAILRVIVKKIH